MKGSLRQQLRRQRRSCRGRDRRYRHGESDEAGRGASGESSPRRRHSTRAKVKAAAYQHRLGRRDLEDTLEYVCLGWVLDEWSAPG